MTKRKAYRGEDDIWRLPLTRGFETLLDEEDALWAQQWAWTTQTGRSSRTVYAHRKSRDVSRRKIYLHREIAERSGFRAGLEVDHVDCDGLNNRRNNLRAATGSDNGANKRLQSNNTSGHKGVSWAKRECAWVAYVWFRGIKRHVGYFSEYEKACDSVDKVRAELHGAFARTR